MPFARPDVGEDEANAVRDTILSGWLTTGERCRELELAFAEAVGARHALALSSCTAALHLSLEALGVGAGDVVVTTPYTFTATAEAIRYLGAVPVFVDIDPETFNLSVDRLEETLDGLASGDTAFLPPAWRDKVEAAPPAAVIPVHVGGTPCDLDRIAALASAHGSAIVEDAAHAFGAQIAGRSIGAPITPALRSTACFSFYATKTITTGEGGMLVTDDTDVIERARVMSLHGMSRDAWARDDTRDAWNYDVVTPGFKYNMTDLAAVLGLTQLKKAGAMRARRAAIATRYTEAFSAHEGLEVPTIPPEVESAWHLYMLRLRPEVCTISRDDLVTSLREAGIGTSVHFIPLHLHSYYAKTYGHERDDFPVAVAEFEREVSLPISSALSDAEVARVIDAVTAVVSGRR